MRRIGRQQANYPPHDYLGESPYNAINYVKWPTGAHVLKYVLALVLQVKEAH